MIAKSDLFILVISASALSVGLYRWQMYGVAPAVAAMSPSAPFVADRAPSAAPADPAAPLVARSDGRADTASDPAVTADEAVVVRRLPADGGTPDGDRGTTGTSPGTSPGAAADTVTAARQPASGGGEPLYGVYVVRSGDYLGKIAEQFGTSVATLRSINDLEGTTIHVDQPLRYPLPAN